MSVLSKPYFHDEQAALDHLESIVWPDGPTCPHCGAVDRINKLTGVEDKKSRVRIGLWKCYHCRKQFTVRVGTLFERSHVPLCKWFQACYLMCSSKKGVSSHQLHRTLEVTYKTAWFMAHRIRMAMKDFSPPQLGGKGKYVEADETYFGGKRKFKNEDYIFITGKGWIGPSRSMDHKQKVFTLVERGGAAMSFHVESATINILRPLVVKHVHRKSTLMTDDAWQYKSIGKEFPRHGCINHSAGEYGRGDITTNTVEGFFSIFKRGMKGIYQHCGERHLHRYLVEYDFRYSHRKISDLERTEEALRGIVGKRLTYGGPCRP